jgi:hypothetical protein
MFAQQAAPVGSALASWTPLLVLLGAYAVIVVALLLAGGPRRSTNGLIDTFVARVSSSLERLTGLPGWAAAAVGTSLYGLLLAGQGFYSDVAWHIALGRDKDLFTAPHTSIVLGLGFILFGAVLGIVFATFERVEVGTRVGGLRVPWSMLPLGALGLSALAGFPLDDFWHRQYGIDVTMWSPTHMLMILGASFSGMASWLVLAEAKISPTDSRWARGVHVVAAWLTLQGLASSQGEFVFGVPQFQQLFHPILVCIAAGFALVAMRLVLGRWWALGISVVSFALMASHALSGGGADSPVPTRAGGLYVISALVVEIVAARLGTDRRLRFALASGIGIGTIGLASEFAYNANAYQPWTSNLLPEAAIFGVIAAVGAAILGAVFARAVKREPLSLRLPRWTVVVAGVALVACLVLPMSRQVGAVNADVHLEDAARGEVLVHVRLEPANAAEHARWFQTVSWQGGTLVLAEMVKVADGEYVSDRPLPIEGKGKVILRLHRGAEMNAFPIHLPADPEINKPEIAAVDRSGPFTHETDFLLRETTSSAGWYAYLVYGLLTVVAVVWVLAFRIAAKRAGRPPFIEDRALVSA